MERDGSKLYLPAFFHEALGKEYSVFSDRRGRSHNLARLAIATYIKGELLQGTDDSGLVRYRPTWATDLLVDVFINQTDPDGPTCIDEVALRGNGSTALKVRYEEDFVVPTLHIAGGSLERAEIIALDIDEEMDRARQLVVQQTQSMIDHTAKH